MSSDQYSKLQRQAFQNAEPAPITQYTHDVYMRNLEEKNAMLEKELNQLRKRREMRERNSSNSGAVDPAMMPVNQNEQEQ